MIKTRLTTSEQVILNLVKKKKTKTWLAEHLQMTRPTLNERLITNIWKLDELFRLKDLNLIIE